MAAPALWPASAPPLSRFATTTLVAAMSNPPPPPKAKPSRAASASGATSIITSAGTLRAVLRRSFQAMARIFLIGTGGAAYSLSARPVRCRNTISRFGSRDVDLGDARAGRGRRLEQPRQHLVRVLREQHGLVFLDVDLLDALDLAPALGHALEVVVHARGHARAFADDLHQLLVRAEGDHLAVVDDADAVAELLRLGHVVRGVEDRHPLVAEREDAVEDRPPALRVDPHRRLVEVEHLGLVQQRDADVDAPLHAAAELVDAVLLAVDEGDELQHLVDPLLERVPGQPVHPPPEHEVLAGAHVRVEGDVLWDHADGLLDRLRVAHHGVAGDGGVAAARLEQAAQHGDGGALAGAVGTEEAEDLALLDAEADAVDGEDAFGGSYCLRSSLTSTMLTGAPSPASRLPRTPPLYTRTAGGGHARARPPPAVSGPLRQATYRAPLRRTVAGAHELISEDDQPGAVRVRALPESSARPLRVTVRAAAAAEWPCAAGSSGPPSQTDGGTPRSDTSELHGLSLPPHTPQEPGAAGLVTATVGRARRGRLTPFG